MELTKLATVDDVSAAISAVIEGPKPRELKPSLQRQRAARLAELHELRAQYFRELDLSTVVAPDQATRNALAMAVTLAEEKDRDKAAFWRTIAGVR
jgi:predicted glycosyltransferase